MRRAFWVVLCVALVAVTCLPAAPASAQTESKSDPYQIVRSARTIFIAGTKTCPPEPLEKKLFEDKDFQSWGYVLLRSQADADLVIELERKEWTWDFTYRLVHPRSGVILGSGKEIAWDGVRAAPGLAKQIVQRLKTLRTGPPPPAEPKKKE